MPTTKRSTPKEPLFPTGTIRVWVERYGTSFLLVLRAEQVVDPFEVAYFRAEHGELLGHLCSMLVSKVRYAARQEDPADYGGGDWQIALEEYGRTSEFEEEEWAFIPVLSLRHLLLDWDDAAWQFERDLAAYFSKTQKSPGDSALIESPGDRAGRD